MNQGDPPEVSRQVSMEEFKNSVKQSDFDSTQLETAISKFKKTNFGRTLEQLLRQKRRNGEVHTWLRLKLHKSLFAAMSRGGVDPQEVNPDDVAKKQGLVDKIGQETGHNFASVESTPNIYKVDWIGKDEIVVREDVLYNNTDGRESGISENSYTIYKGGKNAGTVSFAHLKGDGHWPAGYAKVSERPFPLGQFVDGVSGRNTNSFVYLNPKSPYLVPAK